MTDPLRSTAGATHDAVAGAPGRPRSRTVALWPREHGAYAALGFPLAVAHATGSATPSGWLMTLAATAAFVGHEPLLVRLGRRGARARRERGRQAAVWLTATATVAALAATAAVATTPTAARASFALPAALVTTMGVVLAADRERTLFGEVLAAVTFAAFAVPVALAGGTDPHRTWATFLVWCLGAIASTGAVRAIVAHQRAPRSAAARFAATGAATALAIAFGALGWLDARATMALMPVLEATGLLALLAPHPRMLRVVGYTLLGANALTAALLAL
jgi:hypothetical protein